MAEEQYNPQVSYESSLKLGDLEESQKLMKERVLLIGQNLIESQEKNRLDITDLKKEIYEIKTTLKRLKEIVEALSEEFSKTARKEELAILERQYKMFEPLKFARIEDVEKIIEKKLHNKTEVEKESPHKFWTGKI